MLNCPDDSGEGRIRFMDVIKDLIRLKEERGYSYGFLAEKSGIEAGTLQKILTGKTRHPHQKTLEALIETYSSLYGRVDYIVRFDAEKGVEDELQGKYTVADWENLPDDMRMELIDGVFYDMGQPTIRHQVIAQEVLLQFKAFIRNNHGHCLPILAPIGVQLNRDEKSMLEPDLIVVCDPERFGETEGKWFPGEPDFILEVLSKHTKKKDMTLKLRKYEEAGVKEYWIVDPERESVIAYEFSAEVTPTIYNFTDKVPVSIYGGRLTIDFAEILDTLKMYESWKE